jgi:hypothetical protein
MLTHDGKCYRGNLRENSEDNSTSAKQNSPIVIQDDIGTNWQTKNENLLIWSCWNKKSIWQPWLQENVTRRDNNNNSKSSDPNGLRRCVSRVLPPWQQPYTETTTRKEEWRGGLYLWILDCNSSLCIDSQRDYANPEGQEEDKKWNLTATKSPQKLEWLILHICSNIIPSETSNLLTTRSSERNTSRRPRRESNPQRLWRWKAATPSRNIKPYNREKESMKGTRKKYLREEPTDGT